MSILPITAADGTLSRFSGMQLLSLMTYPGAPELRRALYESYLDELERMRQRGQARILRQDIPQRSNEPRATFDINMRRAEQESWPNTQIAGDVLTSLLRLDRHRPDEVGLNRAFALTHRKLRMTGRVKQPYTIQHAWLDYASVGHLWAAHLFWRASEPRGQNFGWLRRSRLPLFLAMAEWYRGQSEAFLTRHSLGNNVLTQAVPQMGRPPPGLDLPVIDLVLSPPGELVNRLAYGPRAWFSWW